MQQTIFQWNFREVGNGEVERLPRESGFFVGGDLDIPGSLVREFIQNSLDAHRKTPVRVRFTFVSQKTSDTPWLYEALLKHLQASGLLDATAIADGFVRVLVAEDFNTLGLTGTTRREEVVEESSSNYYNFWWREGIAEKRGTQRGRWGLGKVTFHMASKLRSFWGLTTRADDKRCLLLGKCLLRPHRVDGKLFDCYGYFSDEQYRPIEEREFLDDFCRRFGINRDIEPGLSIVIPAIRDDVTPEMITRAAIMYYFWPIERGELAVEIQAEGGSHMELNSTNLRDIAQAQSWEETAWHDVDINSLMDFVEFASRLQNSGIVNTLPVPPQRPEISEDVLGESLETLRNNFRRGQLMAFRIPVVVRPVEGAPEESFFDIFVKKDERLEKSEEFYWRSGVLITGIRTMGRQRIRILLSAIDEPICGFLGDSETPAHTDWNERTEDFKKRYGNAVATLRFIKRSAREIVRILDIPPVGRETDFLKEVFHIRELAQEAGSNKGVTPPDIPPHEKKPPLFDVSAVSGGFCLRLANIKNTNITLPLDAEVTVAYDIRRGNPFKNYSTWDFDLARLKRRISGGHVLSVSDNKMTIRVEKHSFKLEVRGFDPKRDLIVLAR